MDDKSKIFILLVILVLVIFYSCDSYHDMKSDLSEKYADQVYDVKSYYYHLYEDILYEYSHMYYEFEDDPGRTVPMENFPDPEDLRFPIEDYLP